MRYIFMHIGSDDQQPFMLVKSIRTLNPEAEIIQCSDKKTPKIKGVNNVIRVNSKANNLMMARLELFSEVETKGKGGCFIDTDMLATKSIYGQDLSTDLVLCERSFGREAPFNHTYKNMDYSEYTGWSLGEVYPYLACFTYSQKDGFWDQCREALKCMNSKYHYWYGDQEALKTIGKPLIENGQAKTIPEARAACLPEYINGQDPPFFVHFKGEKRKPFMKILFEKICK
jgi:hypothetical protein